MKKKPKIIVFDIEILPDLDKALEVWPRISAYPGLTLKASINSLLCVGFKEYGKRRTSCINAWDYPAWEKDVNNDFYPTRDIHKVLSEADAVVSHNGKRFDWKFLQSRFLKHGLNPMHKIPHIDTCLLARRNLLNFNNKLDSLGKEFVGEKKLDNEGWDLWVKAYNRDKKALNKMEKYCKQDVRLTDKLLEKLLPFVSNFPNYNLFQDENTKLCPNCGSLRLRVHGYRHTKTRTYKRLKCWECGTTSSTDFKGENPRTY